jgi:hypothetical protein
MCDEEINYLGWLLLGDLSDVLPSGEMSSRLGAEGS